MVEHSEVALKCTHHDFKGPPCTEDATMRVEIKHQIGPGWQQVTERAYCDDHAQAAIKRHERLAGETLSAKIVM
jgi:hypothetical protein